MKLTALSIHFFLGLSTGFLLGATPCLTTINSGDNIQAAVDCSPSATIFTVKAGVYRLQSVKPKDKDTFIGEPGTILSGAALLTAFTRQGGYWVVNGQVQQGQIHGVCAAGFPRCDRPEDLYFDDKPLLHVGSLNDVGPGTWYFDYAAHTIYFADDPTGHRVETSVARVAFSGSSSNVTIQSVTIEKYAIPPQMGAIGDQYPGPNWLVTNSEVRWNHGVGINLGSGGQAIGNYSHDNGQQGIHAGDSSNILVLNNEISRNNYAGFDSGWEAGGAKFTNGSNISIRGNNVHDNNGPGLWTDIDCINVTYDSNVVTNNFNMGIQHEISFDAKITNNVVRGNGTGFSVWLWGSQILVQNSQNVEVSGNTIGISAAGGNGIGLIEQSRGSGPYGPRITRNNSVHHNDVTYPQNSQGLSGAVTDDGSSAIFSTNNTFDFNTYHVSDLTRAYWSWNNSNQKWTSFKSLGEEAHGLLLNTSANAVVPTMLPNGVASLSDFGGFSTTAPGSWIEIHGSQLGTSKRAWATSDFDGGNAPKSLDQVSVTINGQSAFIEYVSPDQINALIPSTILAGPANVTVSTAQGISQPYDLTVHAYQPGLLAVPSFSINGKQYVVAQFQDGTFVLPPGAIAGVGSRQALAGETITIYGVGFGPVVSASGKIVPAGTVISEATRLTAQPQFLFGQTPAVVTYAGLAPYSTGLYQFNIVVPTTPASDEIPLSFSVAGTSGTQTLYTAIQR